MYFIHKYIINATTTAINACTKKIFDVGQREVIVFIYELHNKGEYSIFSQRKQILKKEATIVKGARVCYCRIYHKFVNFIILNLF